MHIRMTTCADSSHVYPGVIKAAQAGEQGSADIHPHVACGGGGGVAVIGRPGLGQPQGQDVKASNGVIHVIDTVHSMRVWAQMPLTADSNARNVFNAIGSKNGSTCVANTPVVPRPRSTQ